jgi:hypothetical protein
LVQVGCREDVDKPTRGIGQNVTLSHNTVSCLATFVVLWRRTIRQFGVVRF